MAMIRGPQRRLSWQRGFTLVELAITASILSIVTVLSVGKLLQGVHDAAAEATGSYLLAVKSAMDTYLVRHYDRLSSTPGAADVPTVANPYAPKLSELRALGLLQGGFPDLTPLNQSVATRIVATGTCPGTGCRLDALAFTTTAVQLPGSPAPNTDLIAQVMMATAGHGGAVYPEQPAVMRGTAFSLPNPLGALPGIVGVLASLDTTLFNEFVRLRDRRDPDLRGDLSVKGKVTVDNTLALRAPDGQACVVAEPDGSITLRCAGRLNAKTGAFVSDQGDSVIINPVTGIVSNQRVHADAGLSTRRGTLFDATDTTPTLRVNAGQMLLVTSRGLALTVDGQDVVAQGGVSTRRLGLRDLAVPDQACQNTVSVGAGPSAEYARTASGGLAVCSQGVWRSLASLAATGNACTPNGAIATDVASGTGLLCRLGVWGRVDDLLSSYVLVSTVLVSHAALVPKPTCGPLGTGTGIPLIYLIPQLESSKASAFTRRARDLGGHWEVQLVDYDGTPLSAQATALAHLYCKY
jgi:prepilin-type N-terminal cleavage/methylation domain-containing protein